MVGDKKYELQTDIVRQHIKKACENFHRSYVVGVTGLEPATSRPPDAHSTT